jgi:GT2 family glycosyltransferase
MKWALITVSYKSEKDILALYKSAESIGVFKLYIVDNFSSTYTESEKKEARLTFSKYENIEFIDANENGGFAYGCNLGMSKALFDGCTHFMLVNPDCVFTDNQILTKTTKTLEVYDLVAPLITYYPEIEKVYFAGGNINRFTLTTNHTGKGDLTSSIPKNIISSDWLTGACISLKSDTFKKIGLMEESYFLYFEESDWCMRAKKLGLKVATDRETQIGHKVGGSVGKRSLLYTRCMIKNYFKFVYRNGNLLQKFIGTFYGFFYWAPGLYFLYIVSKIRNK